MTKIKMFSLTEYVRTALSSAVYERDENGIIIARVPGAPGFYSQGKTFEEARENLKDAIEGNITLALQLNLPIPELDAIQIKEQDVPAHAA